MQTHRFLTTAHERRRLVLWTLAMLRWIAAVVFAGAPVTARQFYARYRRVSLESLTRRVMLLLIIRSHELARRRPCQRTRVFRYGRDLKRRHLLRSLLGARLRRILKPKTLRARIDALINVLRHLDRYAHPLAKRRLTRLWAIKPAPAPAAAIVSAPCLALAFADSS